MIRYYVYEKNTLGYVNDEYPNSFAPLSSNVKGYDPKNGPIYFDVFKAVIATKTDFDNFRVDSTGHIK